MKFRISLGVLALLACAVAQPQTASASIPFTAKLSWVLPTKGEDGAALTGAAALTEVRVFASPATIPDTVSITSETATLAPAATAWTYTGTAAPASTMYFRIAACNSGGCALSAQVSGQVKVSRPAMATGVAVAVTITVAAP
jgi:hypothetical protein